MISRRVLAGAAVALTLALTGCGSASAEKAADGKTAEQKTAGGKTVAEQGATDQGGTPISAEQLCAHLKKELPRIKAVGSEVGSMAQLAMSLASLYDGHEKALSGEVLDEQTAKSCPDTAADMLKAAGIKSFSEL